MDGIRFVVDENGKRVAVIIDIEKYGDLLEDFFDIVISTERLENETAVPFETVVAEIEGNRRQDRESESAVTAV